MSAAITIYPRFRERFARGGVDLIGLAVSLHTLGYKPSEYDETYADLTDELPHGNGYTRGGAYLQHVRLDSDHQRVTIHADPVAWTPRERTLVARRAVLRTVGADALIASILLDDTNADVLVTPGKDLMLRWGSAGILTLG